MVAWAKEEAQGVKLLLVCCCSEKAVGNETETTPNAMKSFFQPISPWE
jgi:hypothetical protein